MSTAITTALLQYEFDLAKTLRPKDVNGAYMIGVNALAELDNIINTLGNMCEYNAPKKWVYP